MKRLLAICLGLAGCGLFAGLGDYRVAADGGGGALAGGAGGEEPVGCQSDEECGDAEVPCRRAACEESVCGLVFTDAGTPCADLGGDTCDGLGACVKQDGKPCSAAAECASGMCVDDRCCAEACDAVCVACDVPMLEGSCAPVPAVEQDDGCLFPAMCDGNGACSTGDVLWGKRYGDAAIQLVSDIAFDAAGNMIAVGEAEGIFDFGDAIFDTDGIDPFVVKLDPNGNHLFSKVWINPGTQRAVAVAVDPSDGSMIIGGDYSGNVSFDGMPITNGGAISVWLLKLSAGGQLTWVKDIVESNNDQNLSDIALDSGSAIWLAGRLKGNMSFGGNQISSVSTGRFDVFAAKLDPGGGPLFATAWGNGADDQRAVAVTIDASDAPIIAGELRGTVAFGSEMLTSTAGSGLADVIVLKLGTLGAQQWAEVFGGPGYNEVKGCDVDADGNIALGGRFEGSLTFGATALASVGGGEDAFVAVLDPLGTALWAKAYGDLADDGAVQDVAYDVAGNLALVADFEGAISFGGAPYANPTNPNSDDIAVVKLTGEGTHMWSRFYGDGLVQQVSGLAVAADGRVVAGGSFEGSMALGVTTLTSLGTTDAFVICFEP